jgi:hypothetical protein
MLAKFVAVVFDFILDFIVILLFQGATADTSADGGTGTRQSATVAPDLGSLQSF